MKTAKLVVFQRIVGQKSSRPGISVSNSNCGSSGLGGCVYLSSIHPGELAINNDHFLNDR